MDEDDQVQSFEIDGDRMEASRISCVTCASDTYLGAPVTESQEAMSGNRPPCAGRIRFPSRQYQPEFRNRLETDDGHSFLSGNFAQ
jgi:hypothetical protein